MSLTLSLEISQSTTYAELIAYVDMIRPQIEDPEEQMDVDIFDEQGNPLEGAALSFALPGSAPGGSTAVLLSQIDLHLFREALTREIAQDSDRADVGTLKELLLRLDSAAAR